MTRKTDNRTTRTALAQVIAQGGQLPAFTPVPREGKRHDGWTPERQRDFIEALADTGSVHAACKAVNMSQGGAYYLRRQEGAEEFRAAWEKALDLGVQRIEDVAMDRALNGVEEPLYSYGKLVGTRRRYNDRLLMFMLRNRAPERFAEGKPKGLNAIGKMEVERLKKQWREEWEAEQRKVSPEEIRASLDDKLERFRADFERRKAADFARLSPETRRAFALYEKLRARDEARLEAEDAAARELAARPRVTINAKPYRKKEVPEEPETWPKWRSVKDEGWE
ncbi:MAG: hypothetical protein AAF697_01925 [Pseudomonadota bacterium]